MSEGHRERYPMRANGWITISQAARHLYDPGPCAVQERLELAGHLVPKRRSLAAWAFVAFFAALVAVTVAGCDVRDGVTSRAAPIETRKMDTLELPPCFKLVSASSAHGTWSYAARPMKAGETAGTGLLCAWAECDTAYVERYGDGCPAPTVNDKPSKEPTP